MLRNIKPVFGVTSHILKNGELKNVISKDILFKALSCDYCGINTKKSFHSSPPRTRDDRFRKVMKEATGKDGVEEPEFSLSLKRAEEQFPTHELPYKLFEGVPFKDIPVVKVQCSRNNTIMNLVDKDRTVLIRSCGQDGFKNSRKGTNLAAQATGISFGMRMVQQGYKTVRVVLRGFGPGRLSSLKGIILSGANIISITDDTTDCTHQRPRKQRRL